MEDQKQESLVESSNTGRQDSLTSKALEESNPVERGSKPHNKWFEKKAREKESEIPVKIVDIKAEDEFGLKYYDESDELADIRTPEVKFGEFESAEEAIEKWENLTSSNGFGRDMQEVQEDHGFAIDRRSTVKLEIEMPDGSKRKGSWCSGFGTYYPLRLISLPKAVEKQSRASDFSEVSKNKPLETFYEIINGSEYLNLHDGESRNPRRINTSEGKINVDFGSEKALIKDYRLAKHWKKARKRPDHWVGYQVEGVLENDDKGFEDYLLHVDGPIGDTLFGLNENLHERVVEELGCGDPAEVEGEVYLRSHGVEFEYGQRPRKETYGEEASDYALCKDLESRWQMAMDRPKKDETRSQNDDSENFLSKYIPTDII